MISFNESTAHLEWSGDRIKDLRLRMGWSQSDLARRLHVNSLEIAQWEMDLECPQDCITEQLDLLLKLAQWSAEQVSCESLAEIVFDESEATQVDSQSLQNKYLDF